jgi:hypothetical protein
MKINALAIAAAIALSGCATITRGSHQAFTVDTEPSGAHVSTSLGMTCDATPCVFPHVEREASFTVTITKEGYRTWTGAVSHQTAGGGAAGMAGNVLLGGIIGAAVDANSGATQELVPNPLHVTLELESAEAAPAAAEAAPADAQPAAAEPGQAAPAAPPAR